MKKILQMLAWLAFIPVVVPAQRVNADKVPAATKAAFLKQYPQAVAKWEKEGDKYEASFKQHGTPWSLLIDDKGIIIETETGINITDLPAPAQSYMREHYKGKPVIDAAKITQADGTITYEANIGGRDIIFDAAGKFLKEEKD